MDDSNGIDVIALQHSLTAALNECDELREFASRFETYGVNGKSRIRLKSNSAEDRDRIYVEEAELCQIAKDLEMDNLRQIQGLQAENEAYKKAIDAMSPNFANADNIQELEEIIHRDRNNADRAIQEKDQELRSAKNNIAKLEREIEILEETLERAHSMYDSHVAARTLALEENCKYINQQASTILILEENLARSESDRLAELTNIMRMMQALEKTPLDKQDGAISLIKRVIYQQICKLDPSQAIDL